MASICSKVSPGCGRTISSNSDKVAAVETPGIYYEGVYQKGIYVRMKFEGWVFLAYL